MPTVSIVKGGGSLSHNNRTIKNRDVESRSWSPELVKTNRVWVDVPIRAKYDELFGDSLKKYNDKQKRDDRKIKNYYEKIARSKQEKPFYELIVQIGDIHSKDDSIECQKCKTVLEEYCNTFEKRNPNLKVFQMIEHNDESAMTHVHIDFVPISTGNKRGLEVKNSLSGAFKEMGYGRQGFSEWREAQLEEIKGLMLEHDLEYTESLSGRSEHLNIAEYKQYVQAIETLDKELDSKTQKLQQIESRYTELVNENSVLCERNISLKQANLNLKNANEDAAQEKELLKLDIEYLNDQRQKAVVNPTVEIIRDDSVQEVIASIQNSVLKTEKESHDYELERSGRLRELSNQFNQSYELGGFKKDYVKIPVETFSKMKNNFEYVLHVFQELENKVLKPWHKFKESLERMKDSPLQKIIRNENEIEQIKNENSILKQTLEKHGFKLVQKNEPKKPMSIEERLQQARALSKQRVQNSAHQKNRKNFEIER